MSLIDFIQGKFEPTEDQELALKAIGHFLASEDQKVFLFKGYAGTGKTTLTKYLADYLSAEKQAFALMAPTGRAARILNEKTGYEASTIHKGIYNLDELDEVVETTKDGKKKYKFRYHLRQTPGDVRNIYIVDEASMISDRYAEDNFFVFGSGYLLSDLMRYAVPRRGRREDKIIFVGDPAQLPPVGDFISGALTEQYLKDHFGVHPTGFTLKEVIRQSGGNDILNIADYLRKKLNEPQRLTFELKTDGQTTKILRPEEVVGRFLKENPELATTDSIIINYSNKSAFEYNMAVRRVKFEDENKIAPGDTLIVNQNNYNYDIEIMNGTLVKVLEVGELKVRSNIPSWDEDGRECRVSHRFRRLALEVPYYGKKIRVVCQILENFLNNPEARLTYAENIALYVDFKLRHPNLKPKTKPFTDTLRQDSYFNVLKVKYGYAITGHKAQGGEWQSAIVNMDINQGLLSDMSLRWTYTAITRAEQRLYLFNIKSKTQFSGLSYRDERLPTEGRGRSAEKERESLVFTPPENLKALERQMGLEGAEDFLKQKFLEILAMIDDSDIEVTERAGKPYQEHYFFKKEGRKARLVFHYNGKNKFTSVIAAGGNKFDAAFSSELKKHLEQPKDIIVTSSDSIPNPPEKQTESSFSFEGDEELMPLFQGLSELTRKRSILIAEVNHKDYQEIYYFKRENETACLYFFYDKNYQLSTAVSKLTKCNSNKLLADLSEILKQLKNNTDMPLSDAFQLRKDHQFEKALAIYEPLWEDDPEQFNDWAGWSFSFSLFKCQRFEEALEVCRQLYPRYPQSEVLNSHYARCIYYTQFKKDPPPDVATLKKAAEGMFRLSPPHTPYSTTSTAIFQLIKRLQQQKNIDWAEIECWLLKMDPDLLDDKTFRIKDNKGRQREMAGKKERWYSQMISAKGGLNKPKELLETLKAARRQDIKWHYNNDIWFARKEAFAYQQLGNRKKAASILRKIVAKKRDWFLLYDLAQVVTDEKESLELMCQAALARGKNEMKVKLFHSIFSKIEHKEGLKQEAGLHLCLIAAVREENGWEVSSELSDKIATYDIDTNEQGSSSLIMKRLRPFWQKYSGVKPKERLQGKIKTVFENKKAGFIQAHNQSYFFLVQDVRGTPKKGQKVSFEWVDSFNKKKNKPGKRAIKIRQAGNG